MVLQSAQQATNSNRGGRGGSWGGGGRGETPYTKEEILGLLVHEGASFSRRTGGQQLGSPTSAYKGIRLVIYAPRVSHTVGMSCRVCSLCSSARRGHVHAGSLDGRAASDHTERSLQVYGSHHDRITQLVIYQQQPESQELLPVAARFDRTQRRGRGWPHTAVKQVCRKVTHTSLVTIRPPASSCQLRRGSHPPRRSTPFDGLGSHTSLGVG
jgi:hypothetical protein